MENKVVKLLITIFLGMLGIHKFIDGKVGMGILYLFTGGLLGIGYIVDVIKAIIELINEENGGNYSQTYNPIDFDVNQKKINRSTLGKVCSKKVYINSQALNELKQKFIAFDTETTGFRDYIDRIVEIGLVTFCNGNIDNVEGTLVNPGIPIPQAATNVNNITNKMLSEAPDEEKVYDWLVNKYSDLFNGEIIFCAHNAPFDVRFIAKTLERLGYDADIRYVDTCQLARRYIKGLENYKQDTVAAYFGLYNQQSHRAQNDAEICGKILLNILPLIEEETKSKQKLVDGVTPERDDLVICAYIQKKLEEQGADVSYLRFRKTSSNYVNVNCLYTCFKFKTSKNGKYFIVGKLAAKEIDLPIEKCTKSEGEEHYVRCYFTTLDDLEKLEDYFYRMYMRGYNSMQSSYSDDRRWDLSLNESLESEKALTKMEVEELLKGSL